MSSLLASEKGHETTVRAADGNNADGDFEGGGEMTNY